MSDTGCTTGTTGTADIAPPVQCSSGHGTGGQMTPAVNRSIHTPSTRTRTHTTATAANTACTAAGQDTVAITGELSIRDSMYPMTCGGEEEISLARFIGKHGGIDTCRSDTGE